MSNICVYLQNIEPYLKQWFIHEHGGEYPVSLVRGSVESCMLKQFIEKRNEEEATNIDERTLAIYIPTFKDKDPRTYFYLPNRVKVALHKCIKNRFDIQMWQDLHQFSNLGLQIDDIIYAWMEQHGIEPTETNWNAIAKRYQRKRRAYFNAMLQKNKRLQRKKVTESSPSASSSSSPQSDSED